MYSRSALSCIMQLSLRSKQIMHDRPGCKKPRYSNRSFFWRMTIPPLHGYSTHAQLNLLKHRRNYNRRLAIDLLGDTFEVCFCIYTHTYTAAALVPNFGLSGTLQLHPPPTHLLLHHQPSLLSQSSLRPRLLQKHIIVAVE